MTASVIKIKFLNIYKYINIITVIKGKKIQEGTSKGWYLYLHEKITELQFHEKNADETFIFSLKIIIE